MKTGIVRNIDELGRLVIPKEIRKQFGLAPKKEVEFYDGQSAIGVKAFEKDECIICGNAENLKEYKEKKVCAECITKLKSDK